MESSAWGTPTSRGCGGPLRGCGGPWPPLSPEGHMVLVDSFVLAVDLHKVQPHGDSGSLGHRLRPLRPARARPGVGSGAPRQHREPRTRDWGWDRHLRPGSSRGWLQGGHGHRAGPGAGRARRGRRGRSSRRGGQRVPSALPEDPAGPGRAAVSPGTHRGCPGAKTPAMTPETPPLLPHSSLGGLKTPGFWDGGMGGTEETGKTEGMREQGG